MALPPSVAQWKERAEIDYIGPFVKAWASLNAWYRHASGERQDARGLSYVKNNANPVRSGILPLLRPQQLDQHRNPYPDSEAASQFKALVCGFRGYRAHRSEMIPPTIPR